MWVFFLNAHFIAEINWPSAWSPHVAKDINITLIRTPDEVKEDKSVFMNQGEWELLHVLSKYKNFSVDSNEYYAEMKFHVSNIVFYSLDSKTIKLQ